MSFIKAKDLDKIKLDWPNPYHLTEEDAKGQLEDVPLEVITLILKEMVLQGRTDCLKNAQDFGITSNTILDWEMTKDGIAFWTDIWYKERYDVFYDKYTPRKLKERLEEK